MIESSGSFSTSMRLFCQPNAWKTSLCVAFHRAAVTTRLQPSRFRLTIRADVLFSHRPRSQPMSRDTDLWQRYQKYLCVCDDIGLTLDISRMNFDDGYFAKMEPRLQKAYQAMQKLEQGAIANPDENRMVGHYWLRAPKLAPKPELTQEIENTREAIRTFVSGVHSGRIRPEKAARFTDVLSIGIGGSALGPEFVHDALGDVKSDKMAVNFFDNTDWDGMQKVLDQLAGRLDQTGCVVISKSGGTPETHNGMMVARAAYEKDGLNFARHAVAVTGAGSKLDQLAEKQGWLARFP